MQTTVSTLPWILQAPNKAVLAANVVYKAWPYSLSPIDSQHGQEVNYTGVTFKFCRNHITCDHWCITCTFIHQTCTATSWQKMNKSDISWLSTHAHLTHLFKLLKIFLTMPMHGTSSKYGIPSDHISRWHLVEHSPIILHALTFCIHMNRAICHKNIPFPSTFNDLLMNTPALFKHNHTGTCIQHPHKLSNRVWLHTFLLHLLK